MPLYDVKCRYDCGYFHDLMAAIDDRYEIRCPECGGSTQIITRAVATIGPMPSKPLTIKQIGRSFESAGEYRTWQRENPDLQILDNNGSKWKNKKDKVDG